MFVQHLVVVCIWNQRLFCELYSLHCFLHPFVETYTVELMGAETNERICFLNVSPDEVIRSLFYNKNNDSLITVSVYASDNFSSLKCRTTRIEYEFYHLLAKAFFLSCSVFLTDTHTPTPYIRYIRRGKPDAGFPLFESESLKWPGFVEFDDVNGKVLTYSAQDR